MYRIVSFIVIFSFVSVMLFLHQKNSHFSGGEGHADQHGNHQPYEISGKVSKEKLPVVHGKIKRNKEGSYFLEIETRNFRFVPEKVGSKEKSIHEGHAHIYINGEKKQRLYGRYYDLGSLEPGTYQIKVSLNSHNHQVLSNNGREIAYEKRLKVDSSKKN